MTWTTFDTWIANLPIRKPISYWESTISSTLTSLPNWWTKHSISNYKWVWSSPGMYTSRYGSLPVPILMLMTVTLVLCVLRWLSFCGIHCIYCFSIFFVSVCKLFTVFFLFAFISFYFIIMGMFSFLSCHICQTFTWLALPLVSCLQKSLPYQSYKNIYLIFYSSTYIISLFCFIFERLIQLTCFEVGIFSQNFCFTIFSVKIKYDYQAWVGL